MSAVTPSAHVVRVWDLPIRVTHWALVALVLVMVVTGQVNGDWLVWHMRAGYAVFTLLLFRLGWGVLGGHWSRFAHFSWRWPVGQRPWAHAEAVGHAHTGSWSVLALGLLLALQLGSGLMTDDDFLYAGPLAAYVDSAWVSQMSWFHTEPGKLLLLAWVLAHVLAIVFWQRRGHRLLPAMWHGNKTWPEAVPQSKDSWRSRALALVWATVCGTLVVLVLQALN